MNGFVSKKVTTHPRSTPQAISPLPNCKKISLYSLKQGRLFRGVFQFGVFPNNLRNCRVTWNPSLTHQGVQGVQGHVESFFLAPAGIPHRSRPGRVTFSGSILAITDKETSELVTNSGATGGSGGGKGSKLKVKIFQLIIWQTWQRVTPPEN